VDLHGDSTFTIIQSKHKVPPDVMVNQSYRPLFDFIAEKIAGFLVSHPDSDLKSNSVTDQKHHIPYNLGFTFSFTCEQSSLERATLIHWDKGWDIPEAIGKDPCVMLQEAIDKLELPVAVAVLANDSVGALLTRSYTSNQKTSTLGAVIFGTGTNAAYIEKMSNVQWLAKKGGEGEIMVMNTEWGCLGDHLDVLPRTLFDDELDRVSTEPGSQMLEKRVSGLYLGELLRLAILRLVDAGAFSCNFSKSSALFQREGIDSSFLSHLAIAADNKHASKLIEETLSAENVTADDVHAIKILTTAICRRAGRLAGASLSALIIQSGRLVTLSYEGKCQDVEVTEYETSKTPEVPISALERFTCRMKCVWRRILQILGMKSLVGTSIPCIRHREASESTEDCLEENVIDIGADGSLIEFYPNFEAEMRGAMREVPEIGLHGERKVRISLTKDGSGVGAALMAQAVKNQS
jgi:hexokinase